MYKKNNLSKFEEAIEDIKVIIRARYPILYIISDEKEHEIIKLLYSMCKEGTYGKKYQKDMYMWDISRGITMPNIDGKNIYSKTISEESKDPLLAFDWIQENNKDKDSIYILSEFHHYLEEPSIQRKLRLFSEITANNERKMIILLSTKNDGMSGNGKMIPTELENIVNIYDWPYPDEKHITKFLSKDIIPSLNLSLEDAGIEKMSFDREEMKLIVNSCKGMTLSQIDHATSKSIINHKTLLPKTIAIEKKQIIKKSDLCDYIEPSESLEDIGGLANLKRWLKSRKNILSEEAFDFGCNVPNGVLFLGPWGSGKSSAAKAIINDWQIPGLRIDASKIYDMYVGSSERKINSILKLAESISPCIIWFDEIENLFAGSESSNSDGGTSSRVLGIISTWMSEHEGTVFNIFTANDISNSPSKLFRKGRLDEIFIIDLPVEEERKEIFYIHIKKRLERQGKIDIVDNIDINLLSKKSINFSGAEIEAAVNTAFILAYNDDKRDIKTEDIQKACKETIPLSCTKREEIKRMREWQKGRAISASDYICEEIQDIKEFYNLGQKNLDI